MDEDNKKPTFSEEVGLKGRWLLVTQSLWKKVTLIIMPVLDHIYT